MAWRGWRGQPGLAGSWPGCDAPSSQGQGLQLPPTQAWVPQAGQGPTRAPQRAGPGAGGSGSEPQALPSHPCAKASLGDAAAWGRGGCPECSWGAELGRVPHGLTLPPATSKCLALWPGLRTLRPVLGGTSSRVSWCPVASSLTPGQWPQAGSLRRAPREPASATRGRPLLPLPHAAPQRARVTPLPAHGGVSRPVSPGGCGNGFGRRQVSPGAVSGPQMNGLEEGSGPDPWVVEGAVPAPRRALLPMPLPSWPHPVCPARSPGWSWEVRVSRSPAPALSPQSHPRLGTAQSGCEEVWKILGSGTASGHSCPQAPGVEPGQLRRWGWLHPAQSLVPARRVGLSFPTRLRSGPDESLGESAGMGATHDCAWHGPAPGQGAPRRWPRGRGCLRTRMWAGRAPPGPEPRSAQPALWSCPLNRPVVSAPGLRESQGGGRRLVLPWTRRLLPPPRGAARWLLGVPFPRQKRPRQAAWANLCREPHNPTQARGAGSAPPMAYGGVGPPSRSPSCPQNPATCSRGGLGRGCQRQPSGGSGPCRHPGHAARRPWRFTQRGARRLHSSFLHQILFASPSGMAVGARMSSGAWPRPRPRPAVPPQA